ncbi:hypothetical protein BaRGS_00031216 [Batillaria attramentaria]|uniref:Ig-like domain-containing protein n=1 Tax=Batillaria attramentaria TaxID=370345 RepID=A0ABD0JR09_9CAEN
MFVRKGPVYILGCLLMLSASSLCQDPPSVPTLTLSPARISENQDVTIICQAYGSPTPTITLTNQDTGDLSPLVHTWSSLRCEDAARFTCTAAIGIGRDEQASFDLLVQCKPRISSDIQEIYTQLFPDTATSISFDTTAYPTPTRQNLTYLGPTLSPRHAPTEVKDIVLGAYCGQKSKWGGPLYSASCHVTVYNVTSREADGFYGLTVANELGQADYVFEVTTKNALLLPCESGMVQVAHNTHNFSLTCTQYRGGVTWLFKPPGDSSSERTLGWCSDTFCKLTRDVISSLPPELFTLTPLTESSSRLDLSGTATGWGYSGYMYRCRDELRTTTCQVDIVSSDADTMQASSSTLTSTSRESQASMTTSTVSTPITVTGRTAPSAESPSVSQAVVTVESSSVSKAVVTVESPSVSKAVVTVESPSVSKAVVTVESPSVSKAVVTVESPSVSKAVVTVESPSVSKAVVTVESPSVSKAVVTVESPSVSKAVVTVESPSPTRPSPPVTPAGDQPACTLTAWVIGLAVCAVLIALLVLCDVVFCCWLCRRGWVIPCAGNQQQPSEPEPLETDVDGYLTPVGLLGEPSTEPTGPYDSLHMDDVGLRSPYDEIGRHGDQSTA